MAPLAESIPGSIEHVISVGEAGNEATPEMPDTELGVFEWPADRTAPSSAE